MTMKLDHINIRTDDLKSMKQVFIDILGLTEGERPPFGSPGYWLYGGGHSIVHLSTAREDGDTDPTGALNHVAFFDDDYDGLIGRLEKADISYNENTLAGSGVRQVFFRIPHDIQIEVAFAPVTAP